MRNAPKMQNTRWTYSTHDRGMAAATGTVTNGNGTMAYGMDYLIGIYHLHQFNCIVCWYCTVTERLICLAAASGENLFSVPVPVPAAC